MSVFLLPPDALVVGEATRFALRDRTGLLLIPRGAMVATDGQRQQLAARDLYIDSQDSLALKRAMAGKVDSMVRQNALIGEIAKARPDPIDANGTSGPVTRGQDDVPGAWSSLQLRVSALLRDPMQPEFESRLLRVQATLLEMLERDADAALLLLVYRATQETHEYSVSHALLVTVVCELASRQIASWSEAWRPSLRCAALTMNVAMTPLQNLLAIQETPVTADQRAQIDTHAHCGAASLRAAGVMDERWLGAVERHHDSPAGPLLGLPAEQQLARLIQRADIFAARLSPRHRRAPMSATAAAKAAYLDENEQPDEAGSAIIKATGLYPPGSFVRLRNGEVAVVLRRGQRANDPGVASVVNAHGLAIAEPAERDTRLPAFEVTGGVPTHEVKVRLNLERLLKLGKGARPRPLSAGA